MRIPRFIEALRLAREQGIALHLDIKEKGEGAAIYAALRSEGMTERVLFSGEDGNAEDLRAVMPDQYGDRTVWFGPECTRAQVEAAHAQGKFVVANFSDNAHQMDLPAMRAAVAAGVDAINVDYPRLGADAVGRPVEAKLAALAVKASTGGVAGRSAAIRELSHYSGFPTQALLIRLLGDPDARVSRAAAVALVLARPATPAKVFLDALVSNESSARQSAAWALGMTHAPATKALLALTKSGTAAERKEALLAISRCPGDVTADAIMPALDDKTPTVRAAAALALVRHRPEAAAKAVPALLHREEQRSASEYATYLQRGKPKLTQAEIDPIIEDYREHMKLVQALELLPDDVALPLLSREAFRSSEDFSHVTSLPAGYGLWDRIAANPALAIVALDANDIEVADRAEWMLVKADASVLPSVRAAVATAEPAARTRLLYILAWKGDAAAMPLLRSLQTSDKQDEALIHWAMQTIQTLQFQP
jgi:glycerophosphoryl diester phosphodiesterase